MAGVLDSCECCATQRASHAVEVAEAFALRHESFRSLHRSAPRAAEHGGRLGGRDSLRPPSSLAKLGKPRWERRLCGCIRTFPPHSHALWCNRCLWLPALTCNCKPASLSARGTAEVLVCTSLSQRSPMVQTRTCVCQQTKRLSRFRGCRTAALRFLCRRLLLGAGNASRDSACSLISCILLLLLSRRPALPKSHCLPSSADSYHPRHGQQHVSVFLPESSYSFEFVLSLES